MQVTKKKELIEYLKDRLNIAAGHRHDLGIDKRLCMADEIMREDITSACSERDMNANFLRKKIFTLFTLLDNQFQAERKDAIGIEVDPEQDAPEAIYNHVADELIGEMLDAKDQMGTDYSVGLPAFLQATEYYYKIKFERLLMDTKRELNKIEPTIRKQLLTGEGKQEIKKCLRDFVMYPACFMVGAYTKEKFEQDFIRGRIVNRKYSGVGFHRVSPWRVYPMPARKNVTEGADCFIVDDFSLEDLYTFTTKGYDSEGVSAIMEQMENTDHKCCSWLNEQLRTNTYIKEDRKGSMYLADHGTIARGVRYDGAIPKKFFEGEEKGFVFGQVCFLNEEILYTDVQVERRAPIVLSASFRPDTDGTWGVGTVDIGYRIQKTIDFIGSKIVSNIEKTSDFAGLLDSEVAESIAGDRKGGDGSLDIKIDGIEVADLQKVLGRGIQPFYPFRVINTQQQGILVINELKKHMAELMSLPDFVDGSTNVGTVGRTSGGLFLLQRNMSEGVEVVHRDFKYIVQVLGRAIIDKLTENGDIGKVVLNYDIKVRGYDFKEEQSESADEKLKKVQAMAQMLGIQQQFQGVQNTDRLNQLSNNVINDLYPDFDQSQVPPEPPMPQQEQIPQESTLEQELE